MKDYGPYCKDVYYKMRKDHRRKLLLFALVVIAVAAICYPVCINDRVTFLDGYKVILYHLGIGEEPVHIVDFVMWDTLLPRAFACVCVGGLLGLVGTIMQQILANPLADPYTTGISSGAGLGAVLFIAMGISVIPGLTGNNALVMNAFILSLIPISVIILINKFRKTTTAEIILIGMGLMFFFGAANSIVMLAADPNDLQSAFVWGLGNMGRVTWDNVGIVIGASIACLVLFTVLTEKVRVLVNKDEITNTLGENANRLRTCVLVLISFLVACVVSFTGTIGFVGIVAPHVVRLFLGTDLRVLIPASFLSGALIMTLSDVVARLLTLPVGVITSVIGGAMFMFILVKQRKQEVL